MNTKAMIITASASLFAFAVFAGDDLAEYQAAMERADAEGAGLRPVMVRAAASKLASAGALASSESATDSSGWKTYTFDASGALNRTVGGGTLDFTFTVDRHFTDIKSATLTMNAYDVDYPEATERDQVYFNGTGLGRLQGGNNTYHVNTFQLPNPKTLVKYPAQGASSAQNTFYVAVDVDDGDWVTKISWATLTVVAKEGIIVEASDGTEPDKVVVTWEGVSAGKTVDLYRNGSLLESGITSAEYEDYDVQWGVTYSYCVVSSAGVESEPDDGYVCTMPMVEKVEVAELWLTGEGPYNLRVSWNDFDPAKVCVNNVKFEVVKTDATSDKFTYEINARTKMSERVPQDFDLSKDGKIIENGHHGKYAVKITWDAYCVKDGRIVTDADAKYKGEPMKCEGVEAMVYYEKYERYFEKLPNWYRYWVTDGTLTDTSRICIDKRDIFDDNYHFCDNLRKNTLACCSHYQPDVSFDVPASRYPQMSGYFSVKGNRYQCTDLVAAQKTSMQAGTYGLVGAVAKGVYSFAANIPHERKHGDLHKEMAAPSRICLQNTNGHVDYVKRFYGTIVPASKSVNDIFDDLLADLENKGYQDTQYYTMLKGCRDGRFGCNTDFDGDGLVDSTELAKGGFSFLTPNTYLWGWDNYLSYADNEILAREAEKSPIGVDESKDWAFPGCQIPKNNHDLCQLNKDQWSSVRDTWKRKLQTVGLASNGAKSVALAMANGATEEDEISTEALDEFPEFCTNVSDSVFIVRSASVSAHGLVDGKYAELVADVLLNYDGETGIEYLVEAFFADDQGKPVAKAWRTEEFVGGTNTVSFSVPGKIVYSQKSKGYALRYLRVTRSEDEFASVCGWSENVARSTVRLNYSDFAAPEAMLESVSFPELTESRNLVANCRLEICDSAKYELVATLTDTNGNFAAASSVTNVAGKGTKTVPITFAREALYLSKLDGPYTVGFMGLKKNGSTVDSSCRAGLSQAYSYTIFAPTNRSILIDSESFEVDGMRGSDSLVSALSFSFCVTNVLRTETTYQVAMYLCGTNGTFVTDSSRTLGLRPGSNEIEIEFDGGKLRACGVSGPYLIREVVLTPVGGAGTAERFFPKMDPIDLNPEDFGVYPFELAGEPTVAERSGTTAYVVTVPLKVLRPNTVTISALLIDGDGKYVATAKKSVQYEAATTGNVTIEFSSADIAESGRRGPYTIRYLNISSDLEGVEPLRVTSFKEEGLVRDYVLYVDADAKDDSGDGLSWATAKRTIQAAVDQAQDGDVIRVADGTYEPFSCDNMSVRIVGVYGYENTFVDGGNSNRCATLGREESQTNTVLIGFTLKNGDATTDNVLLLWNCGGGVCCGQVYDCAITGCKASKGGGAYYGRLESCLITDNAATTYGGGSYYGERINCTIVGNNGKKDAGGTYYGVTRNSIVWDNTRGSSSSYDDNWAYGSFAYSLTSPLPDGDGNMADDPGFVDEENGDYGLSRDSVCVDAGDDAKVWGEEDLAGYDRIMGNAVDIGAFERVQRKRTYGVAEFAAYYYSSDEGGTFEIEVWGGKTNVATSVDVYLSYATASAKDIDLAKATIDGVTPRGGLKFPVKLAWNAGDTAAKIITIPVKTDKDVEGEESFWLQLASPSGINFGDAATCSLTIEDLSIPSTIGLSQAVNNPSLKASSSGAGKWTVGDDAEFWTSDRGIYNAVSPALAKGKSSTLALSGLTGKGDFVIAFHFEGDADDNSTFSIYAGKNHMKTYTHSSVGSQWQLFTIEEEVKGSHTYSYVFTQGNDPSSKVKIAYAYWVPDGGSAPVMVYVTTGLNGGGYVSGMGYYAVGATAKPMATAYPGYEFDSWYAWSEDESKYVEFSKNPKLTLKVTETMDLMANFNSIPYAEALAVPANAGKVTGLGYCADGKKVTLKATANKGYVFIGWESAGKIIAKTSSLIIDRTKKPAKDSAMQSVITNFSYSTTYKARFITSAEDKANIAAKVNGMSLAPWESKTATNAYATNIWAGVYLEWPVAASALSETTVRVAGLPSGLKFTAKDVTQRIGSGKTAQTIVIVPANTIYGAPSAASKTSTDRKTGAVTVTPSQVKVTVTTAGKSSQTYQIDSTVDPLPVWAQGTFTGPSHDGGRGETNGTVAVTIAANGKVSAKQPVNGKVANFAASYFDSYVADESAFYATLTAKVGKEIVTNELAVCGCEMTIGSGTSALPDTVVTNGYIESDLFDAWQYNWKSEPWKTLIKPLDRQTLTYYIDENDAMIDEYETAPTLGVDGIVGKVTLKFAASGAVTVAGEFVTGVDAKNKAVIYKASGSSTLVPSADCNLVFIYLAPNTTKKFAGHTRTLIINATE